MSVTSAWIENRQKITGLDYQAIQPSLETADAVRNPNDSGQSLRFLNDLLTKTEQYETGKQLPIVFKR